MRTGLRRLAVLPIGLLLVAACAAPTAPPTAVPAAAAGDATAQQTRSPEPAAVKAPETLAETFTLQWTVEPAGAGGIAVLPIRLSYKKGEEVRFRALPGEGFRFKSWGGDLSGAETPQTLVVDSNKAIVAVFEPVEAQSAPTPLHTSTPAPAPTAEVVPKATPVPIPTATPQPTPTQVPGSLPVRLPSPAAGLVHWWPADGNANDIVGGSHGTSRGVTFAPGVIGRAFRFDNTADLVALSTQPQVSTALTISAWVKFDKDFFDDSHWIFNNGQFFLSKLDSLVKTRFEEVPAI